MIVDVVMKLGAVCVAAALTLAAILLLTYVGATLGGSPRLALGSACRPLTEWVADTFGATTPFCVDTR